MLPYMQLLAMEFTVLLYMYIDRLELLTCVFSVFVASEIFHGHSTYNSHT